MAGKSLKERAIYYIENSVREPEISGKIHQALSEPGKLLALSESAIFSWSEAVLRICSVFGQVSELTLDYAISLDLLAASADIFDDIADGDNFNTAWSSMKLGEQLSVAMLLWQLGARLLAETSTPELKILAMDYYHKFLTESCIGQAKDVFNLKPSSLQACYGIAEQKSGSLTALCCVLGGLSAGTTAQTTEILAEIGRVVGTINQLNNDIKGILEPDLKSDISLRKITLPVAFCLYKPGLKTDAKITNYYLQAGAEIKPTEIAEAVIGEGGVLYTREVINTLKNQLLLLVSRLPLEAEGRDNFVKIFITTEKG